MCVRDGELYLSNIGCVMMWFFFLRFDSARLRFTRSGSCWEKIVRISIGDKRGDVDTAGNEGVVR